MSYETIDDIADFSYGENTIFINSIGDYCNVTAIYNRPFITHNSMEDVRPGSHCALYCAHKDCGSAMRFYKKNEKALQGACRSISYLKFGARELLLDERYSFKDREKCSAAVN